MPMSISGSAMTSKRRTCLMHYIDKRLCVLYREVVDCFIPVLTREDHLNQQREFTRKKCTCDQTSTGYGVVMERGESGEVGIQRNVMAMKSYLHWAPMLRERCEVRRVLNQVQRHRCFHKGVNEECRECRVVVGPPPGGS